EPEVPRHPGGDALQQGRAVRPRARPHGRLGSVPHQALHQGRPAARGERLRPPCGRARGSRQRRRLTPSVSSIPSTHQGACMPAHKILVVDDSPTERYFLADLLTKKGYKVITAENGQEAMAKVKVERPAVVVLDVVMPG